jgi:hypothetical protein
VLALTVTAEEVPLDPVGQRRVDGRTRAARIKAGFRILGVHVHDAVSVGGEESHLAFRIATIASEGSSKSAASRFYRRWFIDDVPGSFGLHSQSSFNTGSADAV